MAKEAPGAGHVPDHGEGRVREQRAGGRQRRRGLGDTWRTEEEAGEEGVTQQHGCSPHNVLPFLDRDRRQETVMQGAKTD